MHEGRSPASVADFLDWRAEARSFEQMAGAGGWSAILAGPERTEHIAGLQLTEGMFRMLGATPQLGRLPAPEEYQPGRDHVVVLSHALWQRLFGGDRAIAGRSITLNNQPHTVIAVMPPRFRFAPFWMTQAEIWAPLSTSDRAANRSARFLRVFARLKPGVSIERAQAEMDAIAGRLARAYPGTNAKYRPRVTPLHEQVVGKVRPALIAVAGAVAFVLLIVCANTAGLALARAVDRRREIAVRVALGAGRRRVLRQLLTESLLLSAIAGVLGAGLAVWWVAGLKAFLESGADRVSSRFPRTGELAVDGWALALTGGLALLTGVLFGVAPALEALRAGVNESLREGGRGAHQSGRAVRLRGAMVAAEIALSLVLLAGAGLMVRSFLGLRAFDPGFEPRGVLSAVVSVAGQEQLVGERRDAFYRQALAEVRSLPGVRSASMVNHLPVGGDVWSNPAYAEGKPLPRPGEAVEAVYRVCRPGYFGTMRIRLTAGRDFTERDDERAPPVAIINQKLADRLWPGEDAVGKRISSDRETWRTVVGIVRDVAQQWSVDAGTEFYIPFRQDRGFFGSPELHRANMTLVLRAAGDPAALSNTVRARVRAINSQAAVSDVRTMDHVIAQALWQARLNVMLLASFAVFAVLLAAVGIYGVMAYSVGRRSHEIGIRMALGAARPAVLWMVLRQALVLIAAGLAIGLPAALALTSALSTMVYHVGTRDPATFIAVPLVLAAVALAAAFLPARRASGVDPVTALRAE
jgi:putative ABC transport system permease protein